MGRESKKGIGHLWSNDAFRKVARANLEFQRELNEDRFDQYLESRGVRTWDWYRGKL